MEVQMESEELHECRKYTDPSQIKHLTPPKPEPNMKLSAYIVLALSAVYVSAMPVADAEPEAFPDALPNMELEARGPSKAECKAACKKGSDAVEKICRRVPHPAVRALCWGAAVAAQTQAGQKTCVVFCESL
ncbi:hypothetical protein AJ80_01153 [Polytolypa hystricis UAMH7299]|uniref:Big defensin domain-containing protein n=1 Tax=Polytolypa hystricis (strain UAMH7299) TaxID=1447883 RepID=A0A2B7YZT5_POLH7|nr:hypothetical protein AJ80_01153 [Polytolypa hystricis UAMH7299]